VCYQQEGGFSMLPLQQTQAVQQSLVVPLQLCLHCVSKLVVPLQLCLPRISKLGQRQRGSVGDPVRPPIEVEQWAACKQAKFVFYQDQLVNTSSHTRSRHRSHFATNSTIQSKLMDELVDSLTDRSIDVRIDRLMHFVYSNCVFVPDMGQMQVNEKQA